jgi:hypothetical protein
LGVGRPSIEEKMDYDQTEEQYTEPSSPAHTTAKVERLDSTMEERDGDKQDKHDQDSKLNGNDKEGTTTKKKTRKCSCCQKQGKNAR